MSKPQDRRRQQVRLARLEIVATLYKRGYSIRKIQSEVMKRLDLRTYALGTVHSDIKILMEEWRENRIEDMDAALQLELERIDDMVKEAWEAWGKSKTDPRYLEIINKLLIERRKLLGLYAPEKKDIQGGMSFASFLVESGMLDEAEQQGGE